MGNILNDFTYSHPTASFVIFATIIVAVTAIAVRKLCKLVVNQAHGEVVPQVAVPDKEVFAYRSAEAQRIYDDLPALGKARVDKERAQMSKAAGIAGVGLWTAFAAFVADPAALGVPIFIGGRMAYRNWKAQNEVIRSAEERKAKRLS